jgi:hypothetical protein
MHAYGSNPMRYIHDEATHHIKNPHGTAKRTKKINKLVLLQGNLEIIYIYIYIYIWALLSRVFFGWEKSTRKETTSLEK